MLYDQIQRKGKSIESCESNLAIPNYIIPIKKGEKKEKK
jgi:hypothetical protein